MQRYEADENPSPPGPIVCADHADVPVLVPPSEFERLSRAYGAPDSTCLAELVRQNGSLVPLFEPSHRITLSVSRTSDPSSSASLDLSKDSTLSDLRHDASLALGFDAYDARCIDAFGGRWCVVFPPRCDKTHKHKCVRESFALSTPAGMTTLTGGATIRSYHKLI